MLNLTSQRAKIREGMVHIRLQMRFEKKLRRQLAKEFRRMVSEVANWYRNGGLSGIATPISKHRNRLFNILKSYYADVGMLFGRRVIQAAEEAKKFAPGHLANAIGRWFTDIADLRANELSARSKKLAVGHLQKLGSEGFSVEEVAERMEKNLSKNMPVNRAKTIARTEIHSASQFGLLAGAESLQVPMIKEWIDIGDSSTRESHRNVKPVRLHEDFNVGGHPMAFPGDPKGPVDEVVNCRCSMAFEEAA